MSARVMSHGSGWLLLGVGVLCAASAGAAPQIGASRTALATVVDARGRSIVDLEADDVVVRERGQPRDVLSVRAADYPIAIVLDNSLGSGRDFDPIRDAAQRFIGRVGHRPIALVQADPVALVAGFDDDRAVVTERLQNIVAGTSSEGMFQAIVTAARTIQESGSPFSAIVVVSATPLSSVPNELLTPILESGATVHVVVSGARGGLEAAATRSSETLRALADQTRGQFTTIYAAASYQAALDRLADRLAPELLVEYVVPVGSSSGNDVQLGVRIPGARVVGVGVR
jgi:hypothetical protein